MSFELKTKFKKFQKNCEKLVNQGRGRGQGSKVRIMRTTYLDWEFTSLVNFLNFEKDETQITATTRWKLTIGHKLYFVATIFTT